MAQGILTQADYEALNRVLPELYILRDVTELMPVMLEIANRLIPTTLSTYNEFNIETGALVAAYRPPEMQGPMEARMPQMAATVGENPLFQNYQMTGEGDPRFISDFLTNEEWLTNKFRLASRPLEVEDTLLFALTDTKPLWIYLALNRPQRDFTERDRAMAGLLRTHFSAAYANALAYTQSQAKAMVFDQMTDSSHYGLMLLDESNQILHISPSANDLMRRYFPLQDGWQVQLPTHLQNWIKELDVSTSVTLSPLILVHDEKRLVIRASLLEKNRRTLLLRETTPTSGPGRLESLGLSKREAEVLYWIAEGKGNLSQPEVLGTVLIEGMHLIPDPQPGRAHGTFDFFDQGNMGNGCPRLRWLGGANPSYIHPLNCTRATMEHEITPTFLLLSSWHFDFLSGLLVTCDGDLGC